MTAAWLATVALATPDPLATITETLLGFEPDGSVLVQRRTVRHDPEGGPDVFGNAVPRWLWVAVPDPASLPVVGPSAPEE